MTRMFGRLFVISTLGLALSAVSAEPGHAQRVKQVRTKDCCSACQFTRTIKVRGRPVTVPVRPPICINRERVPIYAFCPLFKYTCR